MTDRNMTISVIDEPDSGIIRVYNEATGHEIQLVRDSIKEMKRLEQLEQDAKFFGYEVQHTSYHW